MRLQIKLFLALCLLITTIALPAQAAANQFVVIASNTNNNQVPAGKAFSGDQSLSLVAGESVTLISQSGQVLNLQGPFSGAINKNNNGQKAPDNNQEDAKNWPSTLTKITKLVTKDSNRTAVIGASRNAIPVPGGTPDTTDDYWFMNVDSSGDRCVRTKDVMLWRDSPTKAIKIELRSQTAKRAGLMWGLHKFQMPLPSEFIKDGILVVMKIDQQPRRFNMHVLPEWIDEKKLGKVLLWMVNRNCTRQSQRLINTLQAENR